MRDRLGERASHEWGELTGASPVDRGRKGPKVHLITERAGLPLSMGVCAADTHDSRALVSLVRGIRPVRSR